MCCMYVKSRFMTEEKMKKIYQKNLQKHLGLLILFVVHLLRIQKLMQTRNTDYIYKNGLD